MTEVYNLGVLRLATSNRTTLVNLENQADELCSLQVFTFAKSHSSSPPLTYSYEVSARALVYKATSLIVLCFDELTSRPTCLCGARSHIRLSERAVAL